MRRGRLFTAEEERPGADLTAIVSYKYWARHNFDPQILGQAVIVNNHHFRIIGVMPEGFSGTTSALSPLLYVPLSAYALVMNDFDGPVNSLMARNNYDLLVFGRLKPGLTQQQATSSLQVVASRLERAYPADNKDQTLLVHRLSRMSLSTDPSDDNGLRIPALMLLSLSAVVLLIASLNLANMVMASGTARRREIGIRLALGGNRRRIVVQLVTEGMLLALLGGIAGLAVAGWSTSLLVRTFEVIAPVDILYVARPDWRVMTITLLFCALSTVVFALTPALQVSKTDVWTNLKHAMGARTSESNTGRRRLFSRSNLLVMAQLALSLMMLAAAALFVRSASRAANVQPGFALDNEVLAEVDAGLANIDQAHAAPIYKSLLDRLGQIQGVQSVALAATAPFGMVELGKAAIPIEARDRKPLPLRYNIVSADYFATLEIPVLRGRTFSAAECSIGSKANAGIIDKLAAHKLFGGADPIGKHILVDEANNVQRDVEIVGVVGDIQERILGDQHQPHLFAPFGPAYQSDAQFHLKIASAGQEQRILADVRRVVRATDEQLPLLTLKTMRGQLESGIDIWVMRTGAHILEIFASVALVLAVIGLYALNAFTVSLRTREIGIRMALGADRSSTLKLVLREALQVVAVGAGVGLLLAIAIGRLLSSFLYEVPPFDLFALTATAGILCVSSLLASYLPARRAALVDPMVALRDE